MGFAGKGSSAQAKDRYLASLNSSGTPEFLLGKNTSTILRNDPKLLLFTLARYKFVAKMFDGFDSVLEVGCQEGFGASIVAAVVRRLHGIDFYSEYIDSCHRRLHLENASFTAADILDAPMPEKYQGVFALDVLEHIEPEDENRFMCNVLRSLALDGVVILGMPSLESQQYASVASRAGHVNCKSGKEFRAFVQQYFSNVFMFSMNDEVLHTGFFPMSHYLLALCCRSISVEATNLTGERNDLS